jgi:TolB-like protein/class 3 adenylate cyclase
MIHANMSNISATAHDNMHMGHGHAGHDHTAMVADFRHRFRVSMLLTAPVLVLSPLVQNLLGLGNRLAFSGDYYVLFGLSAVVYFYCGWPFLKGIYNELAERRPGMLTLIAVAISTAFIYSSAVLLGLPGTVFLWELATLVDVMLLGHWLEMKSVIGASRDLTSLGSHLSFLEADRRRRLLAMIIRSAMMPRRDSSSFDSCVAAGRFRVVSGQIERKLAAILAADIVGYSRLAGLDEERTLERLRALRGELIDPVVSVHHGRVVKRTGDGILVEFRSVVDAIRCAVELQNGMIERNAGLPASGRIEFRVGVHLGDVVEEHDGDLMGDGVNIAVRLEGIAQPGGICISEDAYRQVRDRLREDFVDLGDKALKNIARPMRVFSVDVNDPLKPKPSSVASAEPRIRADGSAALGTYAPPLQHGSDHDPLRLAPRLSIVVLPFANFGGHPEQEYFVDGVTESLTTDLSRVAGSFVIARNTAFTYKGKPFDVKQIGRELNVRYVLEGSVQCAGNRMRVNVQLIDAETSAHLWAERFDKPLGDLFKMQDEIVARLAGALKRATRGPRGASRGTLTASRLDGPVFPGLGLCEHRKEPGASASGWPSARPPVSGWCAGRVMTNPPSPLARDNALATGTVPAAHLRAPSSPVPRKCKPSGPQKSRSATDRAGGTAGRSHR